LVCLMVLSFFLGSIVGYCVGLDTAIGNIRRECISRGVARFHPVTGQWEWTVPEVKK
jgi:hypothetical protein